MFAAFRADPRRNLVVLHAVDDVRDVTEPNRRAVLVCDDDGLISVGGKNLVVRPDGERLPRSFETSLRRVHVCLGKNAAHVFEPEPERRNRCRIHLHTHGRLLISLNRDEADACDLAQFLREQSVGEIVHAIERQTVGRNREGEDRCVGWIDLVVFRWVRQIWRQKSAGDIDRGLHILCGHVDRTIKNELQSDCRYTE